jgi:hypothetical protein
MALRARKPRAEAMPLISLALTELELKKQENLTDTNRHTGGLARRECS